MDMNYRNEARLRRDAAKHELATGDDTRLRYAALELRMSMEALTYDRALAFKAEFPPNEYETWQPKKVMFVLLEINREEGGGGRGACSHAALAGDRAGAQHGSAKETL